MTTPPDARNALAEIVAEPITPESLWTALQGRVFLCGHRETMQQSFHLVLSLALAEQSARLAALEAQVEGMRLARRTMADEILALKLHPTTSEEYDAGYIGARNDAFAVVQEVIDALPAEPEPGVAVSIVPPHCSGSALGFDPGTLHVNKDGSGYIAIREDDFVIEDDRCEGPDGPEGSVHWIVRLDASEITALRDFLNGASAPRPALVATQAQAPVIPDGWKLVPVEPTAEMLDAWSDAVNANSGYNLRVWTPEANAPFECWKAILAVAPSPDLPEGEVEPLDRQALTDKLNEKLVDVNTKAYGPSRSDWRFLRTNEIVDVVEAFLATSPSPIDKGEVK